MHDNSFIQEAVRLSRKGIENGEGGPFGCVIIKNGIMVGKGYNKVLSDNDPTAHAEVVAIREACKKLNTFDLEGCELYTSCEPCPMCLSAIYWAHISIIYFCNTKKQAADIGFADDHIYSEIALSPENRKIFMKHIPTEEALQVFNEWQEMENKTQY